MPRLIISIILGLLGCVSLVFSYIGRIEWPITIGYLIITILLFALTLTLYLKPEADHVKMRRDESRRA